MLQREKNKNHAGPNEKHQPRLRLGRHISSPRPRMRKFWNHVGKKNAPWRKPNKMSQPPNAKRDRIVVRRIASAQRPLEMLVDNVRPKKSRRAMLGKQMPRQRNCQKNQNAREKPQFAPAIPPAREQQKNHENSDRENQADQAERENREAGHCRAAPIPDPRINLFSPGEQKQIKADRQFQRKNG